MVAWIGLGWSELDGIMDKRRCKNGEWCLGCVFLDGVFVQLASRIFRILCGVN